MIARWCKVASNLDADPKIRKSGRLGREVFLFALRRNAEPGNRQPGRLPIAELDPWFIADQLMMPEQEAALGLEALLSVGLLSRDGDGYLITAWKSAWGVTKDQRGSERVARFRENNKLAIEKSDVTVSNVTPTVTAEHVTACNADQIRGEEKRKRGPSQGDTALTLSLILKIIANHPGHSLTKLEPAEKNRRVAKWADHIRLMREQDGHAEAEIRSVIDWCQADAFWRKQILSTENLRDKWDKLVAQMGPKAPRPAQAQIPQQPKLVFTIGGVEVER